MGFKPKQDIQSVLNYVRYLFYWQMYSLLQENQNWDDPSYLYPILNVCRQVFKTECISPCFTPKDFSILMHPPWLIENHLKNYNNIILVLQIKFPHK